MTRRPLRGLATTLAGRLGPLAGRLGPLTGRRAGRWRGRSLRSRLVAAAALSVGIVLLGVVGLGYLVVRHELQGQLDRQLHAQADRLGRVWSIAAPAELPPPLFRRFGELNGYTQFLPATGAPLTPPGQAPLPVNEMDRAVAAGAHPAVIEDVPVAGAAVRMLTQPIDGGAVQVALPRGAVDDQLRRLAVAFGVLGAAGLAAAVGLAALVSRPVLAPVGELTEAAERIAATRDLALRIADDRRDELGRLAASFNSMLSALENSARAQQPAGRRRLARTAHPAGQPAHQCRGAAPAGRAARCVQGPGADRDRRPAGGADRPGRRPGRAGPRRGAAAPADRGAVRPDRHRSGRPRRAALAGHPVRRQHRAGSGLRRAGAAGSRGGQPAGQRRQVRRLERGARHRAGAADRGRRAHRARSRPGIPADALPHVFDRFYRADQARALPGSGLGLAIVKQVADSHGGRVEVANAAGGGTLASMRLPPLATDTQLGAHPS